jgi:hypothetical protein
VAEDFKLRRLDQVRRYRGKFSGKIVKPNEDPKNLEMMKGFEKGDRVWVMNASDLRDFLLTSKILSEATSEELEHIERELMGKKK